jgi:hypothetical protein
MGLIILPSQADAKKTFWATNVQAYFTTGVPRGHPEPIILAAFCLKSALRQGCEDIVVEPQGMLPVRFSVRFVQEAIRRDPRKFAGWVPREPKTPTARQRDIIITRHMQRTGLLLT